MYRKGPYLASSSYESPGNEVGTVLYRVWRGDKTFGVVSYHGGGGGGQSPPENVRIFPPLGYCFWCVFCMVCLCKCDK